MSINRLETLEQRVGNINLFNKCIDTVMKSTKNLIITNVEDGIEDYLAVAGVVKSLNSYGYNEDKILDLLKEDEGFLWEPIEKLICKSLIPMGYELTPIKKAQEE